MNDCRFGVSPVNYLILMCTVVKLAGRLAQMVKASAKTTSCKPLSRRYEFNSSQGQFVCLDMLVNGLAVTCRSGWFHSASCLSRGRTHALALLHLNSSRHCCIYGKRALGRTMQQWRVVGIMSRGGKSSMTGLQYVCWGCGWWWAM